MAEKIFASTERRNRSEQRECQICGSPAFYAYFGLISCEACKVFFKRYALLGENRFKCSYNNRCDVQAYNRHLCAACRLSKCFKKGMMVEKIRRSTVHRKNQSTVKVAKLPRLNLLDRDISLLDQHQWILLSNLIHNYQDSKLFLISEIVKNEINSWQSINRTTLRELLAGFHEIAGTSLRSNADIIHLPSDDRSIILHTATTNIVCIGAQFILYHSQLRNCDLLWYCFEQIYGKAVVNCNRWSSKFADLDPITSKLSIALFTFSSNARIFYRDIQTEVTNIHQISSIQDRYAEATWKYLIYRYGYEESIKRYLHIIEWFLALTIVIQNVHEVDLYINDVESIIEKTEIELILDDVDRIVDNNI